MFSVSGTLNEVTNICRTVTQYWSLFFMGSQSFLLGSTEIDEIESLQILGKVFANIFYSLLMNKRHFNVKRKDDSMVMLNLVTYASKAIDTTKNMIRV